ncbi:MAG: hypothetical protein HYR48_03685 [Gemmatimonadetes bacterium]|nr:hypothetical protein [Gemmatimonadota bacterium]
MIINLVPEFLAARDATDRLAAYRDYLGRHRQVLSSYWHNYVLDLDAPPAEHVIAATLAADRRDLERLLAAVDLERVAAEALNVASGILGAEQELDLYLTVGVGAANAGELVIGGRGVVVVCVEHFTGHANPETFGLGLAPELLPLWIAHEVAHLIRYTSATSRSDLRRMIAEAGGVYDCWDLGSRASLRELLLSEGVAVHAARAAAPGHQEENYFGFTRRQYRRMRELESFLFRVSEPDLDRTGLGLRLRYLTGGMSPAARLVQGRVLPERSGYYLGARMAEALVLERGVAAAARAAAPEFTAADTRRAPDRAVGA